MTEQKREEAFPMTKHRFNSWEAILANTHSNTASETDAPPVSCGTWGPRIAIALHEDLSKEERCSFAGHVTPCPACSSHLREYEQIQEDARKLPSYVRSQYMALHEETVPHRTSHRQRQQSRKEYRWKIPIAKLLVSFVCLLWLVHDRALKPLSTRKRKEHL